MERPQCLKLLIEGPLFTLSVSYQISEVAMNNIIIVYKLFLT